MIRRARQFWRLTLATNHAFARDIAHGNVQRLYWAALTVVPLNLLHVAIFWSHTSVPDNARAELWSRALGWVHLAMAVCVALLGWLARRLLRPGHLAWQAQTLSVFTVFSGLLFASVVVAIDQLVTTNITPFLISTLLMGILFGLRPLHAVSIYTLSLLFFCFGLTLTQHDPAQLLTNQLNGVTAVAVGLLLSISYWRKNTENLLLRRKLDRRQRQLQARYGELEILATRDSLTGLFNRKEFMQQAEIELARSTRYGLAACILVADVDHFKKINDLYGHPIGDLVLKHTAGVIQNAIRATDLVGRLGGEEFIVLLPQTTMEEGLRLAEKVRLLVQTQSLALPKPVPGHSHVKLTISLGVVGVDRGESFTLAGMYACADKALYRAKKNGRNRVEATIQQDRTSLLED